VSTNGTITASNIETNPLPHVSINKEAGNNKNADSAPIERNVLKSGIEAQQHPAAVAKITATTHATDSISEAEKKALRAAKFGIPPSEDVKKAARASRFGIAEKKTKEELIASEELKKKERAERFASSSTTNSNSEPKPLDTLDDVSDESTIVG